MIINLKWLQKHILDKLGLVFWLETDEYIDDWTENFPVKIGIVSKSKYNQKNLVK